MTNHNAPETHFTEVLLLRQQDVEPQAKGNDEQRANDGELQERLHDVREHDDVNPQERKFTDVRQ